MMMNDPVSESTRLLPFPFHHHHHHQQHVRSRSSPIDEEEEEDATASTTNNNNHSSKFRAWRSVSLGEALVFVSSLVIAFGCGMAVNSHSQQQAQQTQLQSSSSTSSSRSSSSSYYSKTERKEALPSPASIFFPERIEKRHAAYYSTSRMAVVEENDLRFEWWDKLKEEYYLAASTSTSSNRHNILNKYQDWWSKTEDWFQNTWNTTSESAHDIWIKLHPSPVIAVNTNDDSATTEQQQQSSQQETNTNTNTNSNTNSNELTDEEQAELDWFNQTIHNAHQFGTLVQGFWNDTINNDDNMDTFNATEVDLEQMKQQLQENFEHWWQSVATDQEKEWWNQTVSQHGFPNNYHNTTTITNNMEMSIIFGNHWNDFKSFWWDTTQTATSAAAAAAAAIAPSMEAVQQSWWTATQHWFEQQHEKAIRFLTHSDASNSKQHHHNVRPRDDVDMAEQLDILYLNHTRAYSMLMNGVANWYDYSADFFTIIAGWDAQIDQSYCAVATCAAILNSYHHSHGNRIMIPPKVQSTTTLNSTTDDDDNNNNNDNGDDGVNVAVDSATSNDTDEDALMNDVIELPTDPVYSPHPYATQRDLLASDNECVQTTVIHHNDTYDGLLHHPGGLTLFQTKRLLECHLQQATEKNPNQEIFTVTLQYVDPHQMTVSQVRRDIKQALRDPNKRVFINYHRKVVGQSGSGHFSPIGSYSEKEDAFLILDVAKYKYPPVWIPTARMFKSMATVDSCGIWDYPRGQDRLREEDFSSESSSSDTSVDGQLNATTMHYLKTLQQLGCRPTYRGYVVVDISPVINSNGRTG